MPDQRPTNNPRTLHRNYIMSDQTSNNLIENGIDKFDGSFEKEESGVTIFINQTVNLIKDLDAGGLYMYLLCRPPTWKLNIKHLTDLFDCGKNKIYRILDILISLKLLTRIEIRQKGKFQEYKYRIHLRPKTDQKVQVLPVPQKPEAAKPDTVFEDTYKTNILPLKNKEDITTTTEPVVVVKISDSNNLSPQQIKTLQDTYIENPFETKLIKNQDDFIGAVQFSIEKRGQGITIQGRIKGIIKLVKSGLFEDPPEWKGKNVNKNETEKEKNERIWNLREQERRKIFPYDYNEDGTRKTKLKKS